MILKKIGNGYVDYLLLDSNGFPCAVLEAKSEKLDPLVCEEAEVLRCQTGISKPGPGGRRYLPYAFTEWGAGRERNFFRRRI